MLFFSLFLMYFYIFVINNNELSGKLYYRIDKFEEAKKDFIKHRKKMIRDKMNQSFIDEIDELIKNCEKYTN